MSYVPLFIEPLVNGITYNGSRNNNGIGFPEVPYPFIPLDLCMIARSRRFERFELILGFWLGILAFERFSPISRSRQVDV